MESSSYLVFPILHCTDAEIGDKYFILSHSKVPISSELQGPTDFSLNFTTDPTDPRAVFESTIPPTIVPIRIKSFRTCKPPI